MFGRNWRIHEPLKSKLTKTRQMTSLMEREFAANTPDISYNSENWVRIWIDQGHKITSDCGTLTATRAIDFEGTLVWFVNHPQKKHGYHSTLHDPFAAMDEAQGAWTQRANVRKNWDHVKAMEGDLAWGRKSFVVTIEDAHRSPLCSLGIHWFLKRVGLGGSLRISGRLAALLMRLEPQMGFVIWEAGLVAEAQAGHAQTSPAQAMETPA